jgi:DNA-directed RNA polymerase specialized sigma24 family protein
LARGTQSSSRLENLRSETLASVEDLEEAMEVMHRQLRTLSTTLRRARRHIEGGGLARDIDVAASVSDTRSGTSAALHDVQAARHRGQRAFFKLAAAEGASLAEIARTWGVSRQLVSRIVKEPTPRRRR